MESFFAHSEWEDFVVSREASGNQGKNDANGRGMGKKKRKKEKKKLGRTEGKWQL